MKKLISICLAVILFAATALCLTGCGKSESVKVSSVMRLSDDFRGSRVVTVKYPLSTDIDAIKDTIIREDPSARKEAEGVTFTYKGVEDDGYSFELAFEFNDREDYEREITAVIDRAADSHLSIKDTVLTRGVRMKENFGTDDLIAWIVRATDEDSSTDGLQFDCGDNTVIINDTTYKTDKTVDISEVQGSTVNEISIKTVNDKNGSFSRSFEFAIPNRDYVAYKDQIEQYFLSNTAPAAKDPHWEPDGTYQLYKVRFEDLTKRTLNQYTAMLLDTDGVSIDYGDADNTSTPLSEAQVFEESIDTFSFIGPDDGAPILKYTYILPESTVHGDGSVFTDGKWTPVGEWEGDVYSVELSSGSAHLRIADGTEYAIEGINFRLESLGAERFRRTADFLYSKHTGSAGRDYAVSFFTAHGAQAGASEDDDHLICSVVCEGTASELTKELTKLFGSGNYLAYRKNSGAFSLSTKTTFTDYVDLSAVLNASNAKQPIRYYISASGAENIVSVIIDGSEKAYSSANESCLELSGGVGTVEYYGSIPITSHIVIYVIFGLLLLGATVFGAYRMLRTRRGSLVPGAKRTAGEAGADEDDETLAALTQTTTFSIAELGALSRNKRYVDEINKDIEERIESDRLDRRKREIRQRELEEMERKVYGTDESPALEDVPELDISALKLPDEQPAEAPAESEDVPELDISVLKLPDEQPAEAPALPEKPAVQPSEPPVNPFSLLDDAPEEEEDV